jgi:hypothetical protein
MLGLYAAAFSFAVINDTANPQAALSLHPGLPTAANRAADLVLFTSERAALEERASQSPGQVAPSPLGGKPDITPDIRSRVRALAIMALQGTSLTGHSLRQLAYLQSDATRAMELLVLANRVTRRDPITSLQSAEMKLRRNDVIGGLADLDRALVVSRNADGPVFQALLGGAAADPMLRERVRLRLAREPIWAERMVRWSVANPASLAALSSVVDAIPETSPARAVGYGQEIIGTLISQGRNAEAFSAYRTYSPRTQQIADLAKGTFAPIDWRLIDNYNSGSRVYDKDSIEVFANAGRQGDVAEIVTNFRPGPRRLRLLIDGTEGSGAQVQLSTSCLVGPNAIPNQVSGVDLADGLVSFAFTVPGSGCAYQRLTLRLDAQGEDVAAIIRGGRSSATIAAARP